MEDKQQSAHHQPPVLNYRVRVVDIEISFPVTPLRLSAITLSSVSLGVSSDIFEEKTTPRTTLIEVYDVLHEKFGQNGPSAAASLLYLMLEKLGCSEDVLDGFMAGGPDRNVHSLNLQAALILLVGSIFERINNDDEFEKFIKSRKFINTFKSYQKGSIDTPEKLHNVLCNRGMPDNVQDLVNWLNCHPRSFAKYIDEIDQLYRSHNRDTLERKPRPPSLLSRYKWCILSLIILLGLFLSAIIVLSVFFSYYTNPSVTSDMAPKVLYASPGMGVTSMIQCFDSKTKSMEVKRTEGSNQEYTIEAFVIRKNDLNSTVDTPLPTRVLFKSSTDQIPNIGHRETLRTLNYFNNSNGIFTTTDSVITFDVELNIDPNQLNMSNSDCPFRILAYNDFQEYYRALLKQDSSIYTPSCVTRCLNKTGIYPVPYNLSGNSYYFFVVAFQLRLKYTISVGANLTQYSTENHLRTCNITPTHTDCSLDVADFLQALQVFDEDDRCLVTRFTVPWMIDSSSSFTSNSTLRISLTSHADSVYSAICLFTVSGLFIAVLVPLVAACVCALLLPKLNLV